MVTRETIIEALQRLNDAENARHRIGVEAVSAVIDQIMAPNVEGWRNGAHEWNHETKTKLTVVM